MMEETRAPEHTTTTSTAAAAAVAGEGLFAPSVNSSFCALTASSREQYAALRELHGEEEEEEEEEGVVVVSVEDNGEEEEEEEEDDLPPQQREQLRRKAAVGQKTAPGPLRQSVKRDMLRKEKGYTEHVTAWHVFKGMRARGSQHRFFMANDHDYFQYRLVVCNWMIEVGEYFDLHRMTIHSAVALLDRLMPDTSFNREEWQVIAICCLLISAKYNEREQDVPSLSAFELIAKHPLPAPTMLQYELWILTRCTWDLDIVLPVHLLRYIVHSEGVILADDILHGAEYGTLSGEKRLQIWHSAYERANNLATNCLREYLMKQYPTTVITACIVMRLRQTFGVTPVWRDELTELCDEDARQLPIPFAFICALDNNKLPGEDAQMQFQEALAMQHAAEAATNHSSKGLVAIPTTAGSDTTTATAASTDDTTPTKVDENAPNGKKPLKPSPRGFDEVEGGTPTDATTMGSAAAADKVNVRAYSEQEATEAADAVASILERTRL